MNRKNSKKIPREDMWKKFVDDAVKRMSEEIEKEILESMRKYDNRNQW
jgi:hypothetical protein